MDFAKIEKYDELAEGLIYVNERLSGLRWSLPLDDSDARCIAIRGMQMVVAGYGMGLNSLTYGRNQQQVVQSLGRTNLSADDARKTVEDAWRLGLITLFHFKIDHLITKLLTALGEEPPWGFRAKARRVLDAAEVHNADDGLAVLLTITSIRNSLHNNGIHRNASLTVNLHGMDFHFEEGKPVQCATWGHLLAAMDSSVDVLTGILNAEPIQELSQPILDEYAEAVSRGEAEE